MMGWRKKTAIAVVATFLYLGTGYQFAIYNWDLYHKQEYQNFRVNHRTGRAVYETLWPFTHRLQTPEEKIKNIDAPTVEKIDRTKYIKSMTFFWGFKLIWNFIVVVFLVLVDILSAAGVVVYSFLNFLLSPFGVRL